MSQRSTFGPVVLLGLASAGLAALASSRSVVAPSGDSASTVLTFTNAGVGHLPLASALSLALLASWGVVLVTRGWVRRGVSLVAVLAAAGVLATLALGVGGARSAVRAALATAPGTPTEVHLTAWYWFALAGAVPAVATALAAVKLVPTWPEMGTKYDAPATGSLGTRADTDRVGAAAAEDPDVTSLELWKALDQGLDPTNPTRDAAAGEGTQ